MSEEHPIQGLMTTSMENLHDMIDVNNIIGDPVESPDGSYIIPVSKLGFGFAAGGSEFTTKNNSSESGDDSLPFGGGSGGGVSVTPIAFLIINPKGVKMIHLDENTHIYEKMMDFAPKAFDKIQQLLQESGLQDMMKQQGSQKDKSHDKQDKEQNEKRSQSRQEKHDNDFDNDFE